MHMKPRRPNATIWNRVSEAQREEKPERERGIGRACLNRFFFVACTFSIEFFSRKALHLKSHGEHFENTSWLLLVRARWLHHINGISEYTACIQIGLALLYCRMRMCGWVFFWMCSFFVAFLCFLIVSRGCFCKWKKKIVLKKVTTVRKKTHTACCVYNMHPEEITIYQRHRNILYILPFPPSPSLSLCLFLVR